LREHDFSKFNTLKQRLIDDAETVLGNDFPRLMEALPRSYDPSGTQSLNGGREMGGPLVYEATGTQQQQPSKSGEEDSNPWDDGNPFGNPAAGGLMWTYFDFTFFL